MEREIVYLHPLRLPSDHAHALQILNTCRALAQAGARVGLMVRRNPARPVRDVGEALAETGVAPHEGWRVEWLPARGSGLAARWRVARARGRPVFYARHLRLAAAAARFGRGTRVVELHELGPRVPAALRRADGIVAASAPLRERLIERFAPSAPVEVIPNGVDPAVFSAVRGDGPPRLVYAGQLYPRKGVEVLLRALAELPGVPALVIGGRAGGDPREGELRALAGRLGVGERVSWAGHVSQREIAARLRRGDVAVVPTRADGDQEIGGAPLKLLELMACGLAVLASDLPAIRCALRDGENGRLFAEGDPGALAAGARGLLGDAAARARLGARARADALACAWEARARRILAFLARLG